MRALLRSAGAGLAACLLPACPAPAQPAAPLADAAEQRDRAGIARLLEAGADAGARQPDGMTALHWAAYHDDDELARTLIGAGAEVDAGNRYGVTPLSLACTNGNGRLVALLLEHGADPEAKRRGGETALMTAARTGRVGAVRALLRAGAEVDTAGPRGQTALMWAAAEGNADAVEVLIAAGADLATQTRGGFTPLFFAVREGRTAVVRRLLAAGADVNGAMQIERRRAKGPFPGTAPLLLAMENGHFELAGLLLEAGADPDDARAGGFAPLHALAWIRKPDKGDSEFGNPPPVGSGDVTSLQLARILVVAGADVNARKNGRGGGRRKISVPGTTPFLCAAGTADVPLMETLLELGADPEARDAQGRTALMLAAGMGEGPEGDGPATAAEHEEAVRFLLDRGADPDAVADSGETAMHGAAYKGAPEVVRLLADRGADIRIWARKSKQGRTPLSIAQGYRPGNFKPSFATVAAIEEVMRARGVTPPPPPKKRAEPYRR